MFSATDHQFSSAVSSATSTFLHGNVTYIEGRKAAGVPVEFKIFKGGYHGFEFGSANAVISKAANAFQLDAFERFHDAYALG